MGGGPPTEEPPPAYEELFPEGYAAAAMPDGHAADQGAQAEGGPRDRGGDAGSFRDSIQYIIVFTKTLSKVILKVL